MGRPTHMATVPSQPEKVQEGLPSTGCASHVPFTHQVPHKLSLRFGVYHAAIKLRGGGGGVEGGEECAAIAALLVTKSSY